MKFPVSNEFLASQSLHFPCGVEMTNRFMLAPMTNHQSHPDGCLSDDEYHWLTMRAKGGFGLTMTCAAHVQEIGQGFPGQLGIFSDRHLEGHTRLAAGIRNETSLAVIQLHHAGARSPKSLIGTAPVCPSDFEDMGALGLSLTEVHQLREDFITAAVRAQKAGYDGVEIHGAHGYILCQFLSPMYNRRQDDYGGPLANRARLIVEILDGVRQRCGPSFLLGLRLSPEHHGIDLLECMDLCQQIIDSGLIDFLDVSLWDVFKMPEQAAYQNKSLLDHVLSLNRHAVKLTVAGKISTAAQVKQVLEAGIDFVAIGRAGILHHDYPKQVLANSDFKPVATPVSRAHLAKEGLGPAFIDYMTRWKGFVSEDS